MDSILLQVGVGGIFSILVLREVFNYLTKRNGVGDAGRLKHIDEVISARDQQNERLVYREPGMKTVIENQTQVLGKMTDAIKDQTRWMERVDDRLEDIEDELKKE